MIYKVFKRIMDTLLAFLALVILSPIFLILIMLIKLDSKGPILFRQKRIGKNKKHFNILKFRTMRIDTPKDVPTHQLENPDEWITKMGRFLRKTSLDELPQLFNVLKGDMSLIGPRPERPELVDKFIHEIPGYQLRHKVKAGITGWAQVNGYRGDTSLTGRIQYDLDYIKNWSFLFDIKIFIFTFVKGFINKNAY